MSLALARRAVLQAAAGGGAFNPLSLPWAVWFDARSETGLVEDAPTNVTDQTGNGRHLTNATVGARPTYKTAIVNGHPVYRFDGSSQFVSAAFTLVQPEFVFLVVRLRTFVSNTRYCDGVAGVQAIYQGATAVQIATYAGSPGPGIDVPSWTGFHTIGMLFSGAESAIRIDGGTAVTGNAGTVSSGGFRLGADNTGGGFGAIDIAAGGVMPSAPSSGDRVALEEWARQEFGTP